MEATSDSKCILNSRYSNIWLLLIKTGSLHGLSFVGNILTKLWTYAVIFSFVKRSSILQFSRFIEMIDLSCLQGWRCWARANDILMCVLCIVSSWWYSTFANIFIIERYEFVLIILLSLLSFWLISIFFAFYYILLAMTCVWVWVVLLLNQCGGAMINTTS